MRTVLSTNIYVQKATLPLSFSKAICLSLSLSKNPILLCDIDFDFDFWAMTDGHLFNNISLGGRGGTVSSLSLSLSLSLLVRFILLCDFDFWAMSFCSSIYFFFLNAIS